MLSTVDFRSFGGFVDFGELEFRSAAGGAVTVSGLAVPFRRTTGPGGVLNPAGEQTMADAFCTAPLWVNQGMGPRPEFRHLHSSEPLSRVLGEVVRLENRPEGMYFDALCPNGIGSLAGSGRQGVSVGFFDVGPQQSERYQPHRRIRSAILKEIAVVPAGGGAYQESFVDFPAG